MYFLGFEEKSYLLGQKRCLLKQKTCGTAMVPVRNDAKCFVDRVHATTGTNTSDVIERFGLEKLLRMVPGMQLGMFKKNGPHVTLGCPI